MTRVCRISQCRRLACSNTNAGKHMPAPMFYAPDNGLSSAVGVSAEGRELCSSYSEVPPRTIFQQGY
eukprot:scaffold207_cov409-Prasinococcus_capsulatus_cf.AAC.53